MVVAQTKRKGLPRVDITPTKRKAITIYHDQMGKSFRWIALNAPEFRDTSASHTSIARSYESTKEQGCNYNPREFAYGQGGSINQYWSSYPTWTWSRMHGQSLSGEWKCEGIGLSPKISSGRFHRKNGRVLHSQNTPVHCTSPCPAVWMISGRIMVSGPNTEVFPILP